MSRPHTKARYVEALTYIARALRETPEPEPVAWDLDLLPVQVENELSHLRTEVKRLQLRLGRYEETK